MKNLQLILAGVKGTTTDLTVFLSDSERALFVYLGLALLERVESDPNTFAYKMLVGRLVNAKISLEELKRQFKHDPRTMKRWAEALKSNDPEFIVRAFAGRGFLPKVIGPMIRMVKMRYLQLRTTVRNYRQIIAREVEECFGETVSRETLRQLFAVAREELEAAEKDDNSRKEMMCSSEEKDVSPQHEASEKVPLNPAPFMANSCHLPEISSLDEPMNDNHSPELFPSESLDISSHPTVEKAIEETSVESVESEQSDGSLVNFESEKISKDKTSSSSCSGSLPSLPLKGLPYSGQVPGTQLCAVHHAGQILFSPWFDLIGAERPQAYGLQSQWIGQILQGAVNIEQSHLVCDSSLAFFTGPILVGLRNQRDKLKEMSLSEAVLDVYRANTHLLPDGPGMGTIFYYDPHSKECVTQLDMLKGWCGHLHSIAKVLHLDFIHTQSGLPCFLQHYDNYYDLRERFFMTLSLFGNLFPGGSAAGSTFILDRGIFGCETFGKFRKHGCHLITWEKGYMHDGWDKKQPALMFQCFRERNQAGDLKEYSFECQETTWDKDQSVRRIIVRATNPTGRMIEVSILCTNPDIDIKQIVKLMFNRWVQENDFKYLDRHFGLMQITSYASENYKQIADTLADRLVDSPEYLELKRQFSTIEQALAKQLLQRERKTNQLKTLQAEQKIIDQSLIDIQNRIDELLKIIKVPQKSIKLKQLRDHLRKLKSKHNSLKKRTAKLQDQICILEEEIGKKNQCMLKLDADLDNTMRKQSRLEILIEGCYQRPDIRQKAMMDALRIVAHNMFRSMMDIFRPIYGNYRNDHVMLRMLTRTDGFIWRTDQVVHIRLWLKGRYQTHQKNDFQTFIDQMNNFINGHFCGRAAVVNIGLVDSTSELLSLTRNHGVQIVIPPCSKE
ncbi:MAG: hypothetical protein QF502_05835 [Nitrospinaceae bacterium]|jgi:hypothetical protein|nr:hypothetical protein [Nitrospinaceae bacterium]